jgi:opacity protein-like surface antigen
MRRVCVAAVLASLAAGAAQAAEPKAAPAAEFLEFLGSLDTEDEDWREFLESRPIDNAAGKPAGQKEPPKPDPKQDKVKKP